MNMCDMSFSKCMYIICLQRNIVLSGIVASGVLSTKYLSVVSLALLCVCFDTIVHYSFAKYCDSSGAKSDCSGERRPTKYHIHL